MARKVFADSVVPLPRGDDRVPNGLLVQAATARTASETMEVMFSLALPDEGTQSLEDAVARGDVVPAAELASIQASDQQRSKLEKWLTEHGFSIDHVSDDGTSVYATSTVDNLSKQLQVDMVRVTRDGITTTAARNAPSLPSTVGDGVQAIIGLQPFRRANKHLRMIPPAATQATRTPNAPPYLVSEILRAYGADGLDVDGTGQSIAILIDTFPKAADITAFWKANGIGVKPARIKKINVSGGVLPAPEGEETLDVAWSSGIAPGATVRVYASGSLSFVALDRALDRIIADLPSTPGLRQLSISLGLGEQFWGSPQGEVATQHQKFLRLAAAGVNVFVSSGDAGSNPDQTGHGNHGPLQAEYEASDPAVVGVGGTSLRMTPQGTVESETGWAGSGGGASIFFGKPVWQQGLGIKKRGRHRLVPDVSLVADPSTGALLFLNGTPTQIGGTSWSAPVWAGFCALINEARIKAGKEPLGFLNPQLYPLGASPCFRDVTSGTNGAFTAGVGYDEVTGLGVPDIGQLIKALTS
ncbi:MAG TPA: S53 family peptidase [Kribbella sp.]